MINDLVADAFEVITLPGERVFDKVAAYGAAYEAYLRSLDVWKTLPSDKRELYGNKVVQYLDAIGTPDPSRDETLRGGRRYSILTKEIEAQVNRERSFQLLSLEEFEANSSLLELLEHLENSKQIRDMYKLRKLTTGTAKNAGITDEQARILKSCMRQGRDLFQAGRTGTLMIKPLVWFYSLTSYAYACIILNHVSRYSIDTFANSHGLNYLPSEIRTQFGGSVKQGTFSDLFFSFPTFAHKDPRVDFAQSNEDSLLAFQDLRITSGCGTLFSLLPELRDYYALLTGKPSRVHPLDIIQTSEGRGVKWEFQIGDGQSLPDLATVDKSFLGSPRTVRQGKVIVSVSATELYKISAMIYTDAGGNFWYVDNPFHPVVLPELCVHFLLMNAFSNIMRYRPGDWGDVLLNEVDSDLFLLIRKYFSTFEIKVPILLLRSLSKFNPVIAGFY
ncbi:MAG: YaaC family protein [Janthinobacterium lividum]